MACHHRRSSNPDKPLAKGEHFFKALSNQAMSTVSCQRRVVTEMTSAIKTSEMGIGEGQRGRVNARHGVGGSSLAPRMSAI